MKTQVGREAAATAGVIAYGNLSPYLATGAGQIPLNLAVAAGAVALARADGCSWEELGLRPDTAVDGLRLGLLSAIPVCGVVALGVAIPRTRRFFADERFTDQGARELAFHGFVRIPLATAIAEEVLFRAALFGLALHHHSPRRAVISTAIAFGLWHIVPALRSHDASPTRAQLADRAGGRAATVAGTVAVTAAAGVGFAWLRMRSRSVLAPVIAHAGLNTAALLGAVLTARLRPGSPRG